MNMDDVLRVEDLAKRFDRVPSTIESWIEAGHIPAPRWFGPVRYWLPEDVEGVKPPSNPRSRQPIPERWHEEKDLILQYAQRNDRVGVVARAIAQFCQLRRRDQIAAEAGVSRATVHSWVRKWTDLGIVDFARRVEEYS